MENADIARVLSEIADPLELTGGNAFRVRACRVHDRPLGLDAEKLERHAAAVRGLDGRLRGRPHLLAGVEVDILPDGRLDLSAETLERLDLVPVAISTDAHEKGQLGNLRYGVWVARRGWLEKANVWNALPLAELRRRLGRKPEPR